MLASDLAQCGYLHMKDSIPHHIPVIPTLENIDIADEISCVDVFLVGSSRFGGYLGGPEAYPRHSRLFSELCKGVLEIDIVKQTQVLGDCAITDYP